MSRNERLAYRGVPAKNLTPEERTFTEMLAAEGGTVRTHILKVWPEEFNALSGADQHRFITALTKRTRPYLQQLVEKGARRASVGRETLINMAMKDWEFAYSTGNASAAVAATKNVAALAGIKMDASEGGNSVSDVTELLREVERIVKGGNGDFAIDITPNQESDDDEKS